MEELNNLTLTELYFKAKGIKAEWEKKLKLSEDITLTPSKLEEAAINITEILKGLEWQNKYEIHKLSTHLDIISRCIVNSLLKS